MPSLHLKSSQFSDIVICFLLDKLMHPGEVIPVEINEKFDDLSIVMSNKGLRTVFLQYYMNMDPKLRIQYKLIREVFTDSNQTETSFIRIDKEHIPEKPTIIGKTRKFLKKVLTLGLIK